MYDALREDVRAFARAYGNDITFTRLAVTRAHITEYGLPTAPPKASTHQEKKQMDLTTQAEALDPATLAEIVRHGIESRMDMEVYRQAVETEAEEQAALLEWVKRGEAA